MNHSLIKIAELCPIYEEAKEHRRNFSERVASKKGTRVLKVVLFELCKLPYVSLGGDEHMLVFVDKFSKFMAVFFLSNKTLAHDTVEEFVTMCHNALGCKDPDHPL